MYTSLKLINYAFLCGAAEAKKKLPEATGVESKLLYLISLFSVAQPKASFRQSEASASNPLINYPPSRRKKILSNLLQKHEERGRGGETQTMNIHLIKRYPN